MFRNELKTAMLMAGIVALFGVVGGAIGGQGGMLLGLLFAGATNLFAYGNSGKLVLRLYDAQEVDESSAPQLYRMVAELARNAPFAAMLIQMAISRAREYEADRAGADISQDPQALASALQKTQNYSKQIPDQTAEQHPETAQMMIINPLSGGGIASLFSAHPQTEERAARLLQMARGA